MIFNAISHAVVSVAVLLLWLIALDPIGVFWRIGYCIVASVLILVCTHWVATVASEVMVEPGDYRDPD